MHSIKCENCGASIEMDYEHLIGFCPYCGNKLHFDIEQVEGILREKERTKQVKLQEDGLTERAKMNLEKEKESVNSKRIVLLALIGLWIVSIILFAILSMATLDNVNFSPYQLILILDIVGGVIVIKNWVKKK